MPYVIIKIFISFKWKSMERCLNSIQDCCTIKINSDAIVRSREMIFYVNETKEKGNDATMFCAKRSNFFCISWGAHSHPLLW